MPQLAYTLVAPPQPFVASGLGTASTTARAGGEPITIRWHGAAASVILAGTLAAPGAVDTSADLYLIVATVGSVALTLVKLSDALTTGIDAILSGATWGIVGELTANGVREHQQTAGGTAGSGAGSGVTTDPGGGIVIPPNSPGGILWFNPITHRLELLTPRRGDILRGNLSGIVPIWELYNVSAGAQDQVLTNDLGHTDLPIWAPSTGTGGGGGPGTPTTYPSALPCPCFNLWSGGGNMAPPAGWFTLAFDDSGWAQAALADYGSGNAPVGSDGAVWTGFHPDPGSIAAGIGQRALFRKHYFVPAGTVKSASLVLNADRSMNAYLNGTHIGDEDYYVNRGASFPVDPGIIRPGADNVLAVLGADDPTFPAGDPGDQAWVSWHLVINQ